MGGQYEKKILSICLVTVLMLSACGKSDVKKSSSKEDISWFKSSIEEINKASDKQVIQEHSIERKDGTKEQGNTVYTLNIDDNLIKLESEALNNENDKMEIIYHLKGDKTDLYMLNPETKKMELQKEQPLGEDQKKSMASKALIDDDMSKYEYVGQEKVEGKDAIKIVYHKTLESSLS